MPGLFEFSVSTSGTLLPNGETVSGSTLVNYTEYFQYDVRTSITDFQIPASGNTSYSGINPSYVTPISGTAPILFQPAEWLELDYQLNTYTFTISGESFISYHGDDNSSEEYATCDMTGYTSPSPCSVSDSSHYSSYYGWEAFDRNESNYWRAYNSSNVYPVSIYFNFGTGNKKIINKYRIYPRSLYTATSWLFQGVKDGVGSPSVTNDAHWETIHAVSSYVWGTSVWSEFFTFENSKAYQYYRFKFLEGYDARYLYIGEIHLVEVSDIVYTNYTVLREFNEGTKFLLLKTHITTPLVSGYGSSTTIYPSYQSETASGTYVNLSQKLNNNSYISQVGSYLLWGGGVPIVPNSSTAYATADMSDYTVPSPNIVATTSDFSNYEAWRAFDRYNGNYYCWHTTGGLPASIMYDFGTGNEKLINKYRFQARNYSTTHFPKSWELHGTNEDFPDVSNDDQWTLLDTRTNITNPGQNNWSDWFMFGNLKSYRAYRIKVFSGHTFNTAAIGEIHFVELLEDDFSYLYQQLKYVIAEHTSVSGFNLVEVVSGNNAGEGTYWTPLATSYQVPANGEYYIGVYSDDILWAFSRPFIGKNSARIEGNVEGDCGGVIRPDDYVSVGVRYAPKYNIGTTDTAVVIADGSLNTSEEYATCTMVGNTSPSPCRISYTYSYSFYYGWEAFDRNESNYWWGVYNNWPQSIYFYFGAGEGKVINKYRIYDVSNYGPTTWLFQGNKDGVHEPGVGDDDDWETLHTISGYSWSGSDCWSDWFTLVNTDSYEFYRFKFLEGKNSSRMYVGEIHLVEAQYQPVVGQEFFQDFYLASTSLSGATYLSVSNNTLSTSGSVYLTTNAIQPDAGGLIDLELTVYEPLYTTVSSTTSGYIFKGYNRYTYHDIGHDTLVTEPLLLFTTRSGYTELSDSIGAYNEGIPSTNYNEYLYDSTDRYELQGTNLVRITAASGATAELNIDDLTDLEVHDLKGTIYQWDQYDETWGRFETVGGAAVSLGAGNTNEFIQPGLLIITASGKHYIRQISGDGTAVDGVELDRALPDITISGIYGLDTYSLVVGTTTVTGFDMPNLDGSVNTSTDYATCDMTGYDTPEPCRVEDSDHYSSYYGWEAFDRNTSNYWYIRYTEPPFSVLFDFGAGNETVINKYQIFCSYGYSINTWELQGVVSGMQNPDVSDDAHWETVHSGSKSGSWTGWSGYYTFIGAPYQIYRLKINEVYDDGPQYYTRVAEIQLVSAGRYGSWSVTTSGLYVAHTNDSTQLDTSLWASINGLEVLDSTLGSGLAYHAISFDERQTWKVFKDSDWRDVARDDSGTWKYLTTTGWAVAPENTSTRALYEAFSLAENQVIGTEWEDLTTSDWVSVSGFTTSVTTIDMAFALQQVTDEVPWVNLYRFDYTTTTTSSYYMDYASYNLYLFDSTISGGYSFHLLPLTTQISGTLDIEVIGRQVTSAYTFYINDDPETSYNIRYCTTGNVGPLYECLSAKFVESACNIGSSLNLYLYKIWPGWLWSILISHPRATSTERLLSQWRPFDHYKMPVYDLDPPRMCHESNPTWGTVMLDPLLQTVTPDSDKGKATYTVREDVTGLLWANFHTWIRREDRGYRDDVVADRFNFYSQDFKMSAQRGEWQAMDSRIATKFFINEKFEQVATPETLFLVPQYKTIDFQNDSDVLRQNNKGDAYWWVSSSGTEGHFEDEDGNILVVGSGSLANVCQGMEIDTVLGNFTIISTSSTLSYTASEEYATPDMTSNNTPSPCVVDATTNSSSAYRAFDRDTNSYWSYSSTPHSISFDFGAGNEKCINKYRFYVYSTQAPRRWEIQGNKDGVTSPDVSNDDHWETIASWDYTVSSLEDYWPERSQYLWSEYFYFANSKSYRHYRFKISSNRSYSGYIREIHMVARDFSAEVTLSSGIPNSRVYGIYSSKIENGYLTLASTLEPNGYLNPSEEYATCRLEGDSEYDYVGECRDGGPSEYRANATGYWHENNSYGSRHREWAWKAFERNLTSPFVYDTYGDIWSQGTYVSESHPAAIAFVFGPNHKKVINKFRYIVRYNHDNEEYPEEFKILKPKPGVSPTTGKYMDKDEWDVDNPLYEAQNMPWYGKNSWSPWFAFTNSEPLEGICFWITGISRIYPYDETIKELMYVEASQLTPDGIHVATTSNTSRFKTRWQDDTYIHYCNYIEKVDVSQVLETDTAVWHSVSFDDRQTWKIFKDDEWYPIVSVISGEWAYRNTTSGWTVYSGSDVYDTLGQAFAVPSNRMTALELETINILEWAYSGGFDKDVTETIDFAVGLEGSVSFRPYMDKYEIKYYESLEVLPVGPCYRDVLLGREDCCSLSGTASLVITQPPYTPFGYNSVYGRWVPSGINTWDLETQMYVYRDDVYGDRQWAGLMLLGYYLPSARGGHTKVSDTTNNQLLIMGGRDYFTFYDEVWSFDLVEESSIKVDTSEYTTPTYNYTPSGWPARADHVAVYCGSSYPDLNVSVSGASGVENITLSDAYVLVFGGRYKDVNSRNYTEYNDLWAYSVSNKAWFELQPSGNIPSARYGHAAALDTSNKELFVFGGESGGEILNDVYKYNITNNEWSSVLVSGYVSPRKFHKSIYVYGTGTYNGDIFSFGGTCSGYWLDDLIYMTNNGSYWEWVSLSGIGGHPRQRSHYGIAYEPLENELFIIGGYDGQIIVSSGIDGANNTSTAYATCDMTGYTSPSPCSVSDSYHYSSYYGWEAFDRNESNYWYGVRDYDGWPGRIYFDFGTDNDKIINKYRIYERYGDGPTDWLFQGVKDGVTSPSVTDDDDWETIHEVTSYAWSCSSCWSDWFTFTNSKAYQYYRFKFTAGRDYRYMRIGEIHLVEGEEGINPQIYNDIYKYRIDDQTWSVLDATLSGQTCYHSAEYLYYDSTQSIMMFGGFSPDWGGFTEAFQRIVKEDGTGDPWVNTNTADTFEREKHFICLGTRSTEDYGSKIVTMNTNISGYSDLGDTVRSQEDPGTIWLKFSKQDDGWLYGSYTEDLSTWYTVGSANLGWSSQLGGGLFLGVFVANDCQLTPANSYITGYFDYIKITGSGVRDVIEDEPWELIVEHGDGVNTVNNTGYTQVVQTTKEFEVIYQVDTDLPFKSNEVVCFRTQAIDEYNLRIPYIIDNFVTLFIAADLQDNMPVTTQVEDQIIDLSIHNHRIFMGDDFSLVESTSMRIKPSCQYLMTWNEITARWEVAFYVDGTDQEVLAGTGYTLTSGTSFSNPYVHHGSGSLDFVTSSGYLTTESSEYLALDSEDWTVDFWIYPVDLSIDFQMIGFWAANQPHIWQLSFWYHPNHPAGNNAPGFFLTIRDTEHFLGNVPSFAENEWVHLALVRKGHAIYSFINGYRQQHAYYVTEAPNSEPQALRIGGESKFKAYMDLVRVVKGKALFYEYFNIFNRMDSVAQFKIAGYNDLIVEFNILPDIEPPKLVDVTPSGNAIDFCPTEPVVFDVLDDFAGVNFNTLNIMIDGDLVLENGVNKDVQYDRGTLTWTTRGEVDGEWNFCGTVGSGTVSGVRTCYPPCISGVNRGLYPPGSIYANSGAWGYRFTYQFQSGELPYDHNITIMAWGEDLYGSAFYLDSIEPNDFTDSYDFQVITNKNIQADNFFMPVGRGQTVREDTILTVDMWDTDYPETDLITESGVLVRSDGYKSITYSGTTCSGTTCSGMWWTHWITPSGQLMHRLHYKPEDLFRWDGLRENVFEITIPTTYSACHVERTFTYKLRPGYQIYWDHEKHLAYPAYNQVWNQFYYDSIIPVFIAAKTTTFLPSELTYNCVFHITREHHKDLTVTLEPKIVHKDLEVTLLADNYYLLYDEDVEVIVEAKDFAGNEMQYTFTFHTEIQG